MADPKYASLPGIAYDQPDVYETNDLPESDQNADIYEEESASIERLHITPTEAFSKFKDKQLSAMKVDFSDRLSKNKRTGYDARSGDWELAGYGNSESVLQKYQRLQCEMKDLMDEINNLKEKAKEDAKSDKTPYTSYSSQLEGMLDQLSGINLQESLGNEICASDKVNSEKTQKVIAQLGQLRSESRTTADAAEPEKTDPSKELSSVHYKLALNPGQAALTQTVRLASLEQRLNKIESVVGSANTGKLSRLGSAASRGSLLEVAQQLAARAALLDPTQLDAAEIRVTSLASQLDQVAEKANSIQGGDTQEHDLEKEKKIATLYELAKETSQISQILPQTLDRMAALQTLHQQSCDFTQSLSELESLQTRLKNTSDNNTDLLKKVESSLVDNLANIQANIASLETRVKNLSTKK